ncbi:hypothetical protein Tco_0107830, partial [Tanacetum coccineum]
MSVLPIEPNLAERARISAINLDDYQLDHETLYVDELITQLRQVCEDAEDRASNAQEEARQKRKEALEEVVQRIYCNNNYIDFKRHVICSNVTIFSHITFIHVITVISIVPLIEQSHPDDAQLSAGSPPVNRLTNRNNVDINSGIDTQMLNQLIATRVAEALAVAAVTHA